MISELSFLIDLLLNQKLSKPVKDLIANRIREIEAAPMVRQQVQPRISAQVSIPPDLTGQSPSTIANMMKSPIVHPGMPAMQASIPDTPVEQPVAIVASPQAAQAMLQRQQLIQAAISGKPEPGLRSPRKFHQT